MLSYDVDTAVLRTLTERTARTAIIGLQSDSHSQPSTYCAGSLKIRKKIPLVGMAVSRIERTHALPEHSLRR